MLGRVVSGILLESRYARRQLSRSPLVSITVILVLGIAIGATTAAFAALDAVVLAPLPYRDPQGIVRVQLQDERRGFVVGPSADISRRLAGEAGPIQQFALISRALSHVTGQFEPVEVPTAYVSTSFFHIFGLKPALGRVFVEGDDSRRAVVLSAALWRQQFRGRSSVIGESLAIDDTAYVVIGVMPAQFDYPERVSMWIAGVSAENEFHLRPAPYETVARLKRNMSLGWAQNAAYVVSSAFRQNPRLAGYSLTVTPIRDATSPTYSELVWILFGTALFVLLVACANVANLLLSRATGRRREIAVRAGLGATRSRLAFELFLEGLLLAFAADIVGLALAWCGIEVFRTLAPESFPNLLGMSLDRRVLIFTLLSSGLCASIFSLAPIWRLSRPDLHQDLKDSGPVATMDRRGRLVVKCLLVIQVALSTALLIGASLALTSFWRLSRIDIGTTVGNVVTARLTPFVEYRDSHNRVRFYSDVLDNVRRIVGVRSAAGVEVAPLNGRQVLASMRIVGDRDAESTIIRGRFNIVSSDYFRTLGIPLIAGRDFGETEQSTAVIINEALARRLWPGQSPLGHLLGATTSPIGELSPHDTVVGVVGDVRESLRRAPEPEVYIPLSELPASSLFLVVRTAIDPDAFIGQIKQAVWSADPAQPLSNIRTLAELRAQDTATDRLTTTLLVALGCLATLLAMAGLVAFLLHWISTRTIELGVRSALGASPRRLLWSTIYQVVWPLLFGALVGLLVAFGMAGLLTYTLFDVRAREPLLYALVFMGELSAGLASAYCSVRRTIALDPAAALRRE